MRPSVRLAAGVAVLVWPWAAAARQQPAATTPEAPLTLARLVDPGTRVSVNGRTVQLAIHGLIRFDTLDGLFVYIDGECGRWSFPTDAARQAFGDDLLRRGIESRVVSMQTELPLELLLTHTRDEVAAAIDRLGTTAPDRLFDGRHWRASRTAYRDAFLRVRDRWSTSLNCWSASPSIAARVLSNWYLIDEGIDLFGATYDSTEHFWQAVKYRPDVRIRHVRDLLDAAQRVNWTPWLDALERDQAFAMTNAYALAFLRVNLAPERLASFSRELASAGAPDEPARRAQQRVGRGPGAAVRFTALQEKVLWGDLADVLHLIMSFSDHRGGALPSGAADLRTALTRHGFGSISLDGYAGGRFPYLSATYQDLMLEIWKVKYLQIARFGEVIRSTAGRRLDHFLEDGDSPDIPIPVYVRQLNRIRDLAFAQPRP